MPAQAKSAVEIHRRLEAGQPDDFVARAVGLKPRSIRYHRAWRCRCAVARPAGSAPDVGPGAGTAYRDALAVSVEADLAVLAQVEKQLGLPPLPDVDLDTLLAYAGI